jgi:ubiquinone/menaquinone biosynthesis C-methylase UbiE
MAPCEMSEAGSTNKRIERHYAKPDLATAIIAALKQASIDIDCLKPEDLEPVDEFHLGRREATFELARAAGLQSGLYVLDVGSGLGGPARCMAGEFGCHVLGVDITLEYCRVANLLSQRVGLSGRVAFGQGDGLHLPFSGQTFDVVWTQHTAMNIADKRELYAEMFRVLKPKGVLAIYDVLAGAVSTVRFPVPWAQSLETSFLITPAALRRFIEAAGFTVTSWRDRTAAALKRLTKPASKTHPIGPRPLEIHLLLGPDGPLMVRNIVQNLKETRIALVEVVARK